MILVTDLSIPLRLGITVEARYLDLVWVVAGAAGIGMVMAATGTVTVVGMVVNTTVAPGMAAAGMAVMDTMVADTTSRFAAVEMLRYGKRTESAPSRPAPDLSPAGPIV
jgi:hypothetical protein